MDETTAFKDSQQILQQNSQGTVDTATKPKPNDAVMAQQLFLPKPQPVAARRENATARCLMCDRPSNRRCVQCKSTYYCSDACQETDWLTHSLLCASFGDFQDSKRPTKDHFRCIIFPLETRQPTFVWIRCTWNRDNHQWPEKGAFTGSVPRRDQSVAWCHRRERSLANDIYLHRFRNCMEDNLKVNKSIDGLIPSRPPSWTWKGSVGAHGSVGLDLYPSECRDLDMTDFRYLIDFFQKHGGYWRSLLRAVSFSRHPVLPATHGTTDGSIKGVRINCEPYQANYGRPRFEAVEIGTDDPIFSDPATSDVADRIGLPIAIRGCPTMPRLVRDEYSLLEFDDLDVHHLNLCCEPSVDWAFYGDEWLDGAQSILVIRRDHEPLHPLHLEAICRYCSDEVWPLMKQAANPPSSDAQELGQYMDPGTVLNMICRPTFSTFYWKFIKEKHKKGEICSAVPYPFQTVKTGNTGSRR